MFRRIRKDFEAHGRQIGAQGFWAMLVYRFGRWCQRHPSLALRGLLSYPYQLAFKLVQVLTGIHLPREVRVGRNFIIDHHGGIIVSELASFGHNCRIRNGVVIGHTETGKAWAPRIGNDVDIGAGAKLLGRIRVGNNVAIGANAVVLCDVPDNSIAVGVPAIVKPRRPRAAAQGLA